MFLCLYVCLFLYSPFFLLVFMGYMLPEINLILCDFDFVTIYRRRDREIEQYFQTLMKVRTQVKLKILFQDLFRILSSNLTC